MKPPNILALGSPHADDQAAWRVVERLAEAGEYPGLAVRITSPWDLVPYVQSDAALILIDACRSGARPGTVHRFTARELPCLAGINTSTHGGSLRAAIDLCMALGYDVSNVQVFAIEIGEVDLGAPLSAAVRQAAADVADWIIRAWAPCSIGA